MALLSDTSISGLTEVKGNVSFKYVGASEQHLKLFCIEELLPNQQLGILISRNEIFSQATDIKFGSLSNSLNLNLYVPNSSVNSGFILQASDASNLSKDYSSILAYKDSSGVLTKNCEILVRTNDSNGRAEILFKNRSNGTVVDSIKLTPSSTIFNLTPNINGDVKIKNNSQYATYTIGTPYTGGIVSGYNLHRDYNNAVIFRGAVNITGYDRNDYDNFDLYSNGTANSYYKEHGLPGTISLHGTSSSIIKLYKQGSTSDRWEIIYSTSASSWQDNSIRFRHNGSTKGWLNPDANTDVLAFTGQHRLKTGKQVEFYRDKIGLIVVSLGKYENLDSINKIEINEALPIVEISSKIKQKNVIGVISDSEEIDSDKRAYVIGSFGTAFEKQPTEEDTRLMINSIGEGGIWVTNVNGNLENGDYITTCEIPGYGMKQDSEFLHNYTVAKITCDCDFNLESPIYICEEFEYEGIMYKRAFVGCTYHCG